MVRASLGEGKRGPLRGVCQLSILSPKCRGWILAKPRCPGKPSHPVAVHVTPVITIAVVIGDVGPM